MFLIYFLSNIPAKELLVHADGAVVVAPPEELHKPLAMFFVFLFLLTVLLTSPLFSLSIHRVLHIHSTPKGHSPENSGY